MSVENYIVLAIGVIAVICGPLIVRNRVKLFEFFSDFHRTFTGTQGRAAINRSSPGNVGFVGVMLTIIGLVGIGMGLFGRDL